MTTRISEAQLNGQLLVGIKRNRNDVAKFSEEISSGFKVQLPGDSNLSGTISSFRESLEKVKGYKDRVGTVRSALVFQDDVMAQMNELLTRAKEIATQGANETNGNVARAHLAEEIFEIRDHMATLANSTYQGRYIYGGTADNTPPFNELQYTNPPAPPLLGGARSRWAHSGADGTDDVKTVNITDDLTIDATSPGRNLFEDSVIALERLGRALAGYETLPPIPAVPDGTGRIYNFDPSLGPVDYTIQTQDIEDCIELIDSARETDIIPERAKLGGKLARLDTADSLLDLARVNAEDLISRLQAADVVESASNLTEAENALQASFTVTSRVLNLSILDFI